jgi:hypothetical protein
MADRLRHRFLVECFVLLTAASILLVLLYLLTLIL